MEMTVPQAVRAAYLPHPLTTDGRQVYTEPPKRNETLGGYLRRLGIEVDTHPHAILVNGRALGEAWAKYRLRKGDQILIRAVVRGGGGNAGKVLRTVALVAIAIYAGPLAGALTVGEFAAFAGANTLAMQAGIMIAGSMLVNAVLPPPMPSSSAVGAGTASVEQSPTYSLTGARNRIRKYEPMPLVLGKHRIVPDLAGQPYTVFEGQDQYLLQSFHFGLQADLQLSDFKIGETLLSDYQGVTVYHAGADGQLPAAFGNVDTESGREVAQADGWISRTTSADCVGIGVDVQGIAYYARDDGGVDSQSISYELQYRAVGVAGWSAFGAGSFVLNGDAVNLVRASHFLQVGRGQYEIRIRKTSGDVDSTRQKSQLALAQLRSHQYDGADYTGQRRVGIKIKASSQLNGALDELSAVAQIAVPVWTGSAWVMQVSQNPAWLLLYFLRGGFINGRRAWGAGLPDSRIDIASIKQFAAWCDRKALTCSLVLDRAASIKTVAEQIARCGRAQLTWQSGRYGVVWDDDSLPYVATFGPANIVAGSFRVSYASGQMADEIIVNFANAAKNWEADSVRKVVPGVVNPGNPVTLDFVGCTSADQAGREANLLAAAQQLLRRTISWETDQEGLVASKGDVVMISHDMVSWSHSGRLLDGSRSVLVLDKPVPLSAAGYVGIRFPDGRYYTYRVQPGTGESSTLQLRDLIPATDGSGPLPVPSESDTVPYDWLWFYDEAAQPGKQVKITDVAPTGEGFRFTAVDYLPEYYAAESSAYVYVPPRAANLPLLGWVALSESSRITVDKRRVPVLSASWPPVAGASQYRLRWRRAAGAWAEVSVAGAQWQADVEPGSYDVQVSPVFAGSIGAAVSDSITIVAAGAPPLAVASFAATGEAMQISLRWQYPAQADIASVVLYGTPAGGSKVLLASLAYPADRWVHAGLSAGASWQYELVLVDGWGNRSAAATASATVIKDPSLLLQQLQGAVGRGALDALVGSSVDKVEQMAPQLADLQQRVIPQLNAASEAAAEAALRLVLEADQRAREARRNARVFDAIIDVDPATGQIRLKATAEITTQVDTAIRDVQLLVDAMSGQLAGTVSSIDSQAGRLSAAESKLQLLQTQISLGVQQALAYTDSAVSSNADGLADVQQQLGTLSEAQLRAALATDQQLTDQRWLKVSMAQAKLDIKANADALSAQASATLLLASRLGNAEASLYVTQQTLATESKALASRQEVLKASIAATAAAAASSAMALADADGALSARLDAVQAKADSATAAVQSEATARASAISAEASARQQLATRVGAAESAVTEQASAIDGLRAQKTLRVTAGGKVAGWAAYADANASSFDILADAFRVSLPTGAGSKQVFTVGSVNGSPAVGLSGDLVLDGSITGRALSVDRLSSLSSDLGDATAGRLDLTGSGTGWGYLRSVGKDFADGANGWTLARHPDGSCCVDFKGGAAQFRMSSWGDCLLQFGDAITLRGDGYARVKRLDVIDDPVPIAAATAFVNSGSLTGQSDWECMIDTGINAQSHWAYASSHMYAASATISQGQSFSGGAAGYADVSVVIGDTLESWSHGVIDGRIYIRYCWRGARTPSGSIIITAITWKLARV